MAASRGSVRPKYVLLLLLLFFSFLMAFPRQATSQRFDYPTANLSTTWTNGPNIDHTVDFPDKSMVKALLLRSGPAAYGPSFACGFYCGTGGRRCTSFLFAIFVVYTNSGARITMPTTGIPQVVWSPNRDRPIRENATLQLTEAGDLVLLDSDGAAVWSTNTSGKSVVGMNLTESGNLVLVGGDGKAVWQSFDHPTDTLLPGQRLLVGQRLVANVSASNSTRGQLFLTADTDGLGGYVDSSPPQLYYSHGVTSGNILTYVRYMNGSLSLFTSSNESAPDSSIRLPLITSTQYLRFESDGHLRVYEFGLTGNGWERVAEVLTMYLGDCAYPTVCGSYGMCSNGGQCSCPRGTNKSVDYFRQIDDRLPNLGCTAISPLSCQLSQYHRFLVVKDTAYFTYADSAKTAIVKGVSTSEGCQEACLKNCSCKAALFRFGVNDSDGTCFLPSEIFSLMSNKHEISHYNSTAYIKVQYTSTSPTPASGAFSTPGKKSLPVATIAGSIIGASLAVIAIIAAGIAFLKKWKNKEEVEEDEFVQLPGMPSRYSYMELKIATDNFANKLGQGGFGSVFEGTLGNNTRVAIKRLDNVGQGKREFVAEVETIGSIHHVHLVRLVGFCAEKAHRLLVYEYMSNGSLDKWIFLKNQNKPLDWETRCKIINQVAKGLLYLHEECRQRIAHLDIKPQNILLDENFDAKVSDFGLSKLIDRDQSCVMTTMRGTPGYLAPEWLTSMITEKVDVYSFGVVVVEIVCGRKNIDHSQSEESVHLLGQLRDRAANGQLFNFISRNSPDVGINGNEAFKMLELAIWCLQSDVGKRPSMSMVVKVLEGSLNVDPYLEYNFATFTQNDKNKSIDMTASAPLLPSVLSGPR